MVTLKGAFYTQAIELPGGRTEVINHLHVTDIEVIKRAKRMSVTVYEQRREK